VETFLERIVGSDQIIPNCATLFNNRQKTRKKQESANQSQVSSHVGFVKFKKPFINLDLHLLPSVVPITPSARLLLRGSADR